MDLLDCLDRLGRERTKLEAVISVLDLSESQEGLGLCLECIAERLKDLEDAMAKIVKKEQAA